MNPGETAILDRGYQCYQLFDQWDDDGLLFVCRLRNKNIKTIVEHLPFEQGTQIVFDAKVKLGTKNVNQSQKVYRLVGFEVDEKTYWVATNRFDLKALEIAQIYRLRWTVESFFKWWKRHLSVYHVLARSPHGLAVQIVAGLITYLLIAIYCHENYQDKVKINWVRQIRNEIINDLAARLYGGPQRGIKFLRVRTAFANP